MHKMVLYATIVHVLFRQWILRCGQTYMFRKRSPKPVFICLMVAAVVALLPAGLLNPHTVEAAPGIMRWDTVSTPGSVSNRNDILSHVGDNLTGSEIRSLAVGNDGKTLIAAVTVDNRTLVSTNNPGPLGVLYTTSDGGISWSTASYRRLAENGAWTSDKHVYNVTVAPDDVRIWAIKIGRAHV